MKRRHISPAAVAAGLQRQRTGLASGPLPEPSRSARRAAERAARKARVIYFRLPWRGEEGAE